MGEQDLQHADALAVDDQAGGRRHRAECRTRCVRMLTVGAGPGWEPRPMNTSIPT
jgi:hypothetical protein